MLLRPIDTTTQFSVGLHIHEFIHKYTLMHTHYDGISLAMAMMMNKHIILEELGLVFPPSLLDSQSTHFSAGTFSNHTKLYILSTLHRFDVLEIMLDRSFTHTPHTLHTTFIGKTICSLNDYVCVQSILPLVFSQYRIEEKTHFV